MAEDNTYDRRAQQQPRRSLRVTLAWNGKELIVRRIARVAMLAPPGEREAPPEGAVGFWVELRDAKGTARYHRTMHSPIPTHLEVFAPDRIERVAIEPTPMEFDIIVPDYEDAGELLVWSSPIDRERAGESARVIARVTLAAPGNDGQSGGGNERL